MDRDRTLILAGVTIATTLIVYVLWGPKTSAFVRRGPLIGLQNLGNTCFLNALLQALASCAFFVEWLTQCEEQGRVSTALQNILRILSRERSKYDDIDDPYPPHEIIGAFKQKGVVMDPIGQDAHELFYLLLITLEEEAQNCVAPKLNGCLLDALNPEEMNTNGSQISSLTEVKDFEQGDFSIIDTNDNPHEAPGTSGLGDSTLPKKRIQNLDCNRNPMPSPFRGYLTSQHLCTVCGFKSVLRYDRLDSISLHLPESRTRHTLVQLLDNFFKAEPVPGVVCDGCNRQQGSEEPPVTTTSIKTLSIGKLPRCLCLHISRTTMGPNGTPIKRQDVVEFTEFLPMDSYTRNSRLRRQTVSELESSITLPNIETCHHLYRLKAVIVHRGCVDQGHFVTFRRGPLHSNTRHRCSLSDRWYVTSDAEVRDATLCEALQSPPYMLFYEKCQEAPA